MKKLHSAYSLLSIASLLTLAVVAINVTQAQPIVNDDADGSSDSKFQPVDDVHHFMEYIYEPVLQDLRQQIKKKPVAKLDWKKIKGGSMILAESSTLLAERGESDDPDWVAASLVINTNGKLLYQAARKKDYSASVKHFAAMTEGCNKCHEAFR